MDGSMVGWSDGSIDKMICGSLDSMDSMASTDSMDLKVC
jgi:hypothetical protein